MKKLKGFRTLVTGIIIGVALSFAVTALAAGIIKSAEYNSNKVFFNGEELNLSTPLVSIVDEATPQNAANYMPVRAVLEAMGYEVGWDAANNSINIVSRAEETATSQPLAKVVLNGREIIPEGSSGSASEYVVDYEVVMESLGLLQAVVEWDKNSATISASTPIDEIADPLPIRELLTKLEEQGVTYDVVFNDTKREIYLTKGSSKATVYLPLDDSTTANIVSGKNETEITLVIKGGTTFINESEILAALKKVGFLK